MADRFLDCFCIPCSILLFCILPVSKLIYILFECLYVLTVSCMLIWQSRFSDPARFNTVLVWELMRRFFLFSLCLLTLIRWYQFARLRRHWLLVFRSILKWHQKPESCSFIITLEVTWMGVLIAIYTILYHD